MFLNSLFLRLSVCRFHSAAQHQMTSRAAPFSLSLSRLCTRPRSVDLVVIEFHLSSAAIFPLLLISFVLLMLSFLPASIHRSHNPTPVMPKQMIVSHVATTYPVGLSIPVANSNAINIPVAVVFSPLLIKCLVLSLRFRA